MVSERVVSRRVFIGNYSFLNYLSLLTTNNSPTKQWRFKMKKLFILMMAVALLTMITLAFAQETQSNKVTVPLTDPSKPVTLEAGLMSGGITVVGYNGKEVIVEAKIREKKLEESRIEEFEKQAVLARAGYRAVRNAERAERNSEKSKKKDKAKGMQKLNITSTGLSVEEENNFVEIDVETMRRAVDLIIQVPRRASLKLDCMNNGNIKVENVEGEFELENLNGSITLTDVSGSVVAHTLNKDITVNLQKVAPGKSMSFSTMNGDVDVTLPQKTKATLILKSDMGDIYSDFDMSKHKMVRKVDKEDSRAKGGKYKIKIENNMQVELNGGGPEMQFTTINGDIYMRKGK